MMEDIKRFKLKCEIFADEKSGRIDVLYVCDPVKNKKCDKRSCGDLCKHTKRIECAKHFDWDD
jgi:hypothetical protein